MVISIVNDSDRRHCYKHLKKKSIYNKNWARDSIIPKVTLLTNHAEVIVQGLCYCNSKAWGWHNSHQGCVIGITDYIVIVNDKPSKIMESHFWAARISKKWSFWLFMPNLRELGLFHLDFVCKCSFREISMIKIVIFEQNRPNWIILKKFVICTLHIYYS